MVNLVYLRNYINNDFKEEDKNLIDELEKDPKFMACVLLKTKDKSLFDRLDNDVRTSYIFLKSLLNVFQDDEVYTNRVLNTFSAVFISNSRNKDQLRIQDNLKTIIKLRKENITSNRKIEEILNEIETIDYRTYQRISEEFDISFFDYISSSYDYDECILSFYAKEIINEFFSGYIVKLEEFLHEEYDKKPDEIKTKDIIKRLYERYDKSLAMYIYLHKDLIMQVEEMKNEAIENWDKYDNLLNKKRITKFKELITDYVEINEDELQLTATTISMYAIKRNKQDKVFCELDDNYIEDFDLEDIENGINFATCKALLYAKTLLGRLFKEKRISEIPKFALEEDSNEDNKKGIIIDINNKCSSDQNRR